MRRPRKLMGPSDVHALTRDSSTPRVSMIQKERQYPSPRLTFGDDTCTFNRFLESKTPPDYGPREKYYHIRPSGDSDVSMTSVSKSFPAGDNFDTGWAQSPNDLNRNEQLNER